MDMLTIWFEIASNLFRTFLDAFEHTGDGVMKLIYSCEIAVVCPGQTGMMPKSFGCVKFWAIGRQIVNGQPFAIFSKP